jgi:hypothetical protein
MTTATANIFGAVDGNLATSLSVADVDEFRPTDDGSYFMTTGIKNLMFALLKQSIKDHIQNKKDKHAPADIAASARWLDAKGGQECIQFLMPGVSVGFVTAKIYANPQEILQAMEKGEVSKGPKGDADGVDHIFQDAFSVSGAVAATDAQHAMTRADDADDDSVDALAVDVDGEDSQAVNQERLWGQ